MTSVKPQYQRLLRGILGPVQGATSNVNINSRQVLSVTRESGAKGKRSIESKNIPPQRDRTEPS